MKFKFSKNLDYQLEAIEAVVNIFDTARNLAPTLDFQLRGSTHVVANELEIDKDQLFHNLQSIQKTNHIDSVASDIDDLRTMDFSVEMETGTGKTYVYLRTIMELYKKYALRKFIILVPSVAIREGVSKTIEQTRDHFHELYNFGFGSFIYDSDHLSQVREFIQSTDLQIMIMTVQSFKGKDNLVMRQKPDRFHGDRPIDLVASTHPVVIMDEPQNMESSLSKEAISDLHPLFKLRYSATHREIHNLVYRLTPIEAYRKGLVKKISVWGVQVEDAGAFQFKVNSIDIKKGEYPTARVVVEIQLASGDFESKEIIVRPGDDIAHKTHNTKYSGLEITDINATKGRVELSDGNFYKLDTQVENKLDIFRTQIHETIKAHMDKQEEFGNQIKVLSLFFIDHVDNYVSKTGIVRQIFEEEYIKLHKNYDNFENLEVDAVHKGYFASKKINGQNTYQDTTGKSTADQEAYNLIMKDKEILLSMKQSVSFIFSHSALKEGWDNPNIFQICTLRETNSLMKKRQEIGRGLRLAVNQNGDRIYDPTINVVTVIANESYKNYASSLQAEFDEEGYEGRIIPENAREAKIMVNLNVKQLNSVDFKELWNRISIRTKYNLEVYSSQLIAECVAEINKLNIHNPRVTVEKGHIYFDSREQIQTVSEPGAVGPKIEKKVCIPNVLDRINAETGITKSTIFMILSGVNNLEIIFINPEEFIRSFALIIYNSLNNLLINEGLKYIPTGDMWEVALFEPFLAQKSRSVGSEKSVFDHVIYDSDGERLFAQALENSRNVKVYTKLPRGFYVDTPLGEYHPDWAIVWNDKGSEKLYLVRETKFGYQNLWEELSLSEKQKIDCGTKHFNSIKTDFKVSESKELIDILTGVQIKY